MSNTKPMRANPEDDRQLLKTLQQIDSAIDSVVYADDAGTINVDLVSDALHEAHALLLKQREIMLTGGPSQ